METILITAAAAYVGGVLSAHFVHAEIAKGKAAAARAAQDAVARTERAAKKL